MKLGMMALATVVAAVATPAAAASILNLDARVNSGVKPPGTPNPALVTTFLAQGTYQLSFVGPADGGLFTAATVWNPHPGTCNSQGSNCTQGWFNRASFFFGQTLTSSTVVQSIGSSAQAFRFRTAALSLANATNSANAATFTRTITVAAGGQHFSAYLNDTPTNDNHGGVSLAIAAVPEPSTWMLMIMGFGMIAAALRGQRKALDAAA